MEGGLLHWRIQKLSEKFPDPESYGKPLPPPPHGYFWEKNEDNTWSLCSFNDTSPTPAEVNLVQFEKPSIIEHTIMENDTLPGLCLRYQVSAVTIRRANYFSGNNIRGFKTLRIPIEPGRPINIQIDDEDVMIKKFQNFTNEGKAEARIYLEEHNWNVNKALAAWSGDEKWFSANSLPNDFSRSDESVDEHPIVRATATVVTPIAIIARPVRNDTRVVDAHSVQVSPKSTVVSRYDLGIIPRPKRDDPASSKLLP